MGQLCVLSMVGWLVGWLVGGWVRWVRWGISFVLIGLWFRVSDRNLVVLPAWYLAWYRMRYRPACAPPVQTCLCLQQHTFPCIAGTSRIISLVATYVQ